jgi:arylsulfatase A-like enzyme
MVLLCFVLVLCASPNAGGAAGDAPQPSVILISLDTLRADHLSCYGYTKIHTPHIDAFAQGGTLFAQADAQVPLTLPSHMSLFTSTYPFQNLVEENGERVPAGVVTLASVLQSRGYKTAAFIGSDFLDRRYGLDQGFDVYDSPFGDAAEHSAPTTLRRDGALVVRAARLWLEAHRGPPIGASVSGTGPRDGPGSGNGSADAGPVRTTGPTDRSGPKPTVTERSGPLGGRPVFVFVHLFDLHTPYTLPAEIARKQGISRYDAQLQYVDQVMGRFHQYLAQSGWWQKSIVVVFGDHGEGLGDHQETDHGYYVYESTLHVPLIVHWPENSETRRSKLETGNEKLENRNSKIETGTVEGDRDAVSGGNAAKASSFQHPISSFEFPVSNFQFRVSTPVGLIDVGPTILDYLHVPAPASFEGRSQLGAIKSPGSAGPGAIYSESLYANDAFGWAPLRAVRVGKYKYIQAPKAELYDLAADPREAVNLLPKNAAMAAELQNELQSLLARYAPTRRASVAALSPETLAELESLGYLAVAPRTGTTSTGHGVAGSRSGESLPDPKDRFAEFEQYQNAFVAVTEGHAAVALSEFQTILNLDPQNTLARFHLGECYLQMNQAQNARREWETALTLNPQYAPAAEAIGQYWMAQGDYAKARRRFQQVLALTPESYTAHYQLAVADEHLGLLPEARAQLESACKIAPHDENCARKLKSLTPR